MIILKTYHYTIGFKKKFKDICIEAGHPQEKSETNEKSGI